ncbi:TonB-dependent receptor [Bradyrhizobium sp. LHD-71]|uniref:TonB-dependent receptor n=1 Tax=Bradyrhizobium sp. LHD-71 TaxID=3072141 RepID=UPI00280CE073|nr:TonB-dependent receptor [Bradyrhizobium sp. LHD-71]MDQ8730705.1 TonB-dependent receptor [Bradyrhizobium sp. LHD-71]
MLSSFQRALLCCASTLVISASADRAAQAQGAVTLPQITVTAPSPITRRPAAQPQQPGSVTLPAVAEEPQQGILPIVTDQFATVTVIPNEELRREGAPTLGDQLFAKPGMTGSSFAPGAASRPIIRGLDVNRVGIVENGVDNGGVSDLGEDHFVPVDPLATNQIEVIRGPAALRWGSTSIGGVVSATNNRIPEALPCGPTPLQTYGYSVVAPGPAAGCITAETRSAFSTVDRGVESGVLIDAAGGNVAFHADAYGRRNGDYAIPGHPYLDDPDHPVGGRQPNSSARSFGGSVGASYIFDGGFIGASITHNQARYGIPGLHSSELNERIDARQTRVNVKGEYRPDSPIVDAVRFWLGVTDYKHNELGLEDAADLWSDTIHQTFTNKAQEGRLEVQFMPFDARFAEMTTAVGLQAGHQELTASSPENPGSLFNGLFDPNENTRVAGYLFNEFRFSPATKAQLAGRVEHVNLDGTMPNFPSDFLPDGVPQIGIGRNLSFTPVSGSIGLIHELPGNLVASITGQYVERAPKPAELFSRGSHHATATFDIGNPNLKIESAQSIEASLRKAKGPFRFEATVFYTRFNNFIYRHLTGAFCNDDFDSCHTHDHAHEEPEHEEPAHEGHGHADHLHQAVYTQRDAIFRGGEFQSQLDVAPIFNGVWGIENQFDVVRATFTDGSNVPRIPPARIGGGLFYRDANWFARINLLHAFAQKDIAAEETETAGYNLLRAEISYRTPLDPQRFGARELTVGAYGNNLLNEKIRSAVSFTKNEVLMPGVNVRLFANLKF